MRRPKGPATNVVFGTPSRTERLAVADLLRLETVGGLLILTATVIALCWANFATDSYESVRHVQLGPLDLQHWTADGLLAIFFFLAGMELKRELVVGSLRNPAQAIVPVVAAVAGMIVPAAIYLALNLTLPGGDLGGWAVPMATDIAFALAVLAVVGQHLPSALRIFLLTLAIVDDLGAILIIALFFSSTINVLWLFAAILQLALYALLQHWRVTAWWVYLPLALGTWWAVHESGVHATVAGVALGMLTRVQADKDEERSPADRLEHRIRPLSAGFAVPVFALFAAGVALSVGTLTDMSTSAPALGIVLGLVAGKTIGVLGGSWLATKLTRANLHPDLTWRDIGGVAVLSGMGFTVALLIGDLAFSASPELAEIAKASVLIGSVLAATLASVILAGRSRAYRRLLESEDVADEDLPDGVA